MSKYSKLVKTPGCFFRDFFVKKYPFDFGENNKQLTISEIKKIDAKPRKNIKVATKKVAAKKTVMEAAVMEHDDIFNISFPIDVVYTWVDGSDPSWLESKNKYSGELKNINAAAVSNSRFESRDELKYSLRSISSYMPWVNKIYIVTAGQKPDWLNLMHEKIIVVDHKEIIDEHFLPTFNSHVIEANLHKIPELSENYIYLNDDVMFTRPVKPSDFFSSNGSAYKFPTKTTIPLGPVSIYDTPTFCAAKNVRKLIENKFDKTISRMFAHTFHTQNKSVAEKVESLFYEEYKMFQSNKFRGETDLAVATVLHHNMSFLLGSGVLSKTSCFYFNINSASAKQYYSALLSRKGTNNAPYSMCLNEVESEGLSEEDKRKFDSDFSQFLESYFPNSSDMERINYEEVENVA